MSLSQKHSGKVLVPWFSITEWKSVYKLIYGESTQNWLKALDILHIWKLRTPLLSAGVEGTLILLEALLSDKNRLSSFEIRHIFATSLVRFLNLCAANSERQGSFYKTAKENELPNWLINLRHDIAHSHNVPSQSMLELSLRYCLDWLKPRYWDIQHEQMSDFIVSAATESEQMNIVVSAYIEAVKKGNTQDVKKFPRVHNLIKNNSTQLTRKEIIDHIGQLLGDMIRKHPQKNICDLSALIINEDALLNVDDEIDVSELTKIPNKLMKKWNTLFNIIYETEVMPDFIYNLFQFVCDERQNLNNRKVAGLWIKEIFKGLNNKENNSNKVDVGINFSDSKFCMKDKKFVFEVLHTLTPFTLDFVKEVLEYNDAPAAFVEDSVNLISAFNASKKPEECDILTVDDLNLNLPVAPLMEITETVETQAQSSENSRWILIEDVSPFRNLPLGILPHQSRNINPILEI